MKISINVYSSGVQRILDNLGRHASDLEPAMRDIGAGVVAQAQLGFKDSRDPYGGAWRALSPRTIAARRGRSSKPLLDTGRLRNSITFRVEPGGNAVVIGTNVEYAAIHQFGGSIRFAPRSIKVRLLKNKNGRTVFAKDKQKLGVTEKWGTNSAGWSVSIPARPFIATKERGLPREYGQIIRDALATHFRRGPATAA